MKSIIENTIELIKILHSDQFDWGGNPYWEHPVAVMNRLPDGSSDDRKTIALLHDVLEDCLHNISQIIQKEATLENGVEYLTSLGYSDHVLAGVMLLTRNKADISYLDEIRNIVASDHVDAMFSKLADNLENTSEHRYTKLSEEKLIQAQKMKPRYENSKAILRDGLISKGYDVSWSF